LDEKNDWVTITSGSRPIPLDTEIRERFFALKDRAAPLKDAVIEDCKGDLAQDDLMSKNSGFCTVKLEHIYNATEHLEAGIANTQDVPAGEATDGDATVVIDEDKLAKSLGWYIDLQADYDYETGELKKALGTFKGEKGLASPIILETDDGVKVFFSTYTPWSEDVPLDKCEGMSRLYALDLTSGVGITKSLKNGVTSDISPMFVAGGGLRLIMNDPSLTRCGLEENCDILDEDGGSDIPGIDDPYYGSVRRPQLNRNFWQQIFDEE
jgi:hypothetical protein